MSVRRTDQTRPRSAGQGLTGQRAAPATAGDTAAAAPGPAAPTVTTTAGQSAQQPRTNMTGPSAAPRTDPDRPVDLTAGPDAQTAGGSNTNR